MGLLDFLFGPRPTKVTDPEELKRLLFDAARRGDRKQLEQLCRTNRDAVSEQFPRWQKLPEELHDDPALVQPYVEGLMAIAQIFAERLGDLELMHKLMGSPQDNPLLRWQQGLGRAQKLMQTLRYQEARELLADLLIDGRGLRGSGADRYLPITLGYLGECYLQSRMPDKALGPMEQALELCRQHGDAEGVVAYLGNLYETHRYLGQAEPAAACAEQLADALAQQGRTNEARRYRKQAEVARGGEPLNRVVAVVDGMRYELDEIGLIRDKRVQLCFERNRITLRPATVLAERGQREGSAGRHHEALDTFRAAAAADPFDPHARYLEGLALLELSHYAEAVASYEATEELAPGWFHCRADLWLARQMTVGNIGHETFLALRVLEDGARPPEDQIRLAEQALTRTPQLPPLHLFRGRNLAQLGRVREAEEAYRRGLAASPEPDVRTRLLVELALVVQAPPERLALFHEAEALNGNLVAAATAIIALRAAASSG